MVKVITTLLEVPQDKMVVIDFFANWCGPCKRIAPDYEKLSEKYTDIVFLKVDADDSEKLSESFQINALPTFLFLNKGNVINRLEGADLKELNKNVINLYELIKK
jgi:hypothetical protein